MENQATPCYAMLC